MNQSATILNAIIPVFGMMGLGVVIRKLNWLSEEADKSLMRVCVNVLLPSLILDKSLGNPALSQPSNLILAPLLGYAVVSLGMFIAFCATPLHGLRAARERRTRRRRDNEERQRACSRQSPVSSPQSRVPSPQSCH